VTRFGLNSTCTFTSEAATFNAPASCPANSLAAAFRRVHKAVTSIAVARKRFEQVVIVTFPADAETIEAIPCNRFASTFFFNDSGSTSPRIRRAVGEQNHAIHTMW
jgi:hypothetical protein